MAKTNILNENEKENENDSFSLYKANENVNLWKTCGKPTYPTDEINYKAEILVNKLNAPHCRYFFLKCIYHLPEYKIQDMLELAMRPAVKSHIKYFICLARKELVKIGL